MTAEEFQEVTPDMFGRWKIETVDGSWCALIHDPNRLQFLRAARFTSTEVTRITRLRLPLSPEELQELTGEA